MSESRVSPELAEVDEGGESASRRLEEKVSPIEPKQLTEFGKLTHPFSGPGTAEGGEWGDGGERGHRELPNECDESQISPNGIAQGGPNHVESVAIPQALEFEHTC